MPEKVQKAWDAGGAERSHLIKLFAEAGLDKENVEVKKSYVFGLFSKSFSVCMMPCPEYPLSFSIWDSSVFPPPNAFF